MAVNGTSSADTFYGSVFGGLSPSFDDYYYSRSGNDKIYTVSGNDYVEAGAGGDSVYGGDGADTLDGGSGNDLISGDTGRDVLNGGGDDDTIFGGLDDDFLFGDGGAIELGKAASGFDQQVNTQDSSAQEQPANAALAGGGFVAAWQSDNQDSDGTGVFFQRYDENGAKIGGEVQVNVIESDDQGYPDVAGLTSGGLVVVWQSDNQDGDGQGVYARLFNADGTVASAEIAVTSETTNDQYQPSVAALVGGGFVVAWTSNQQDGSGGGIYAQRFDSAGGKVGAEFVVNVTTAGEQNDPAIAAFDDGSFIIAYASNGQDGSAEGVYARRFGSDGTPIDSAEFQVNIVTSAKQTDPDVTVLNDGGFALIWSSNESGRNDVKLRYYESNGTPRTGEIVVNTTTDLQQEEGAVAATPDGGVIVTWASFKQDGDQMGVFAQRVDADGNFIGGETQINAYIEGDQTDPDIAVSSSGATMFVWSDTDNQFPQDGDSWGVFTNFLAVGGALAGDDTLFGGSGNDLVAGGLGNDLLDGGSGADSILGESGTDRVLFDATDLFVRGGSGVDVLVGTDSQDVFYMDDLRFQDGSQASLVQQGGFEVLDLGGGNDWVIGARPSDTLQDAVQGLLVYGGEGKDRISMFGSASDTFYGGTGNDTFWGGAGDDFYFGGSGNDHFYAGRGADTAYDEAGNDVFYIGAGEGSLVIQGTASEDPGNDALVLWWGQSTAGSYHGFDPSEVTLTYNDLDATVEIAAESNGDPQSAITIVVDQGAVFELQLHDVSVTPGASVAGFVKAVPYTYHWDEAARGGEGAYVDVHGTVFGS